MKVKSGKLKDEAAVELELKCLELLTEKVKVKSRKSESVEDRAVAINTESKNEIPIFWKYKSEKLEIEWYGSCESESGVFWFSDIESESEKREVSECGRWGSSDQYWSSTAQTQGRPTELPAPIFCPFPEQRSYNIWQQNRNKNSDDKDNSVNNHSKAKNTYIKPIHASPQRLT